MSNQIAAKLLAEFVGTFALIFIGAGATAVVGSGAGLPGVAAVAFAHGLTVMAFAFAYGTVSGGHFNPSVTIAVLAAGALKMSRNKFLTTFTISRLLRHAFAAWLGVYYGRHVVRLAAVAAQVVEHWRRPETMVPLHQAGDVLV